MLYSKKKCTFPSLISFNVTYPIPRCTIGKAISSCVRSISHTVYKGPLVKCKERTPIKRRRTTPDGKHLQSPRPHGPSPPGKRRSLRRTAMAPEPEDDIMNEKNPRPLDEDDIALLKTYVRASTLVWISLISWI
jgi:hypothetical protein